jgi:imidazole glycerol-phosphate synthase subunit HisH
MNLIGIIDVGVGNLGSLKSAVYELGFDTCLIQTPNAMAECASVILPGVGSFAYGMFAIEKAGLVKPIRNHVAEGKPLLGICLGMQLLFSDGAEGGGCRGLGLIPGTVRKFQERPSFHVPHVGWNDVSLVREHPVWQRIKPGVDFYFVHSYRAECDARYVVGNTDYGEDFPSVVAFGSVMGVQFHPEKSQRNGLRVLENFCSWNGEC